MIEDLARSIHVYPSFAEIVKDAAEEALGPARRRRESSEVVTEEVLLGIARVRRHLSGLRPARPEAAR